MSSSRNTSSGPTDERQRDEEPLTFATRQRSKRSLPKAREIPFVGQLVEGPRAGMQGREEAESLADRMRSGRAASCSWAPMSRRRRSPATTGSSPSTDNRSAIGRGAVPGGSRPWSSCPRRWSPAGRTARPSSPRTRCRGRRSTSRSVLEPLDLDDIGEVPLDGVLHKVWVAWRMPWANGAPRCHVGIAPRWSTADISPRVGLDDPVVVGEDDRRRPVANAELGEERHRRAS